MGFLGIAASILTGLFGGGSGGGNQAVVQQAMDKILPETEKEKQAAEIAGEEVDIKDVTSARAYQAPDMPVVQYQPGMGIIPFFLLWLLDLIDHTVDTVNHIIRPGFFLYLIGGFMGKWSLPNPNIVDPQLWAIFKIVVVFFFGGRTIFKDILPGLQALKYNLKKGPEDKQ